MVAIPRALFRNGLFCAALLAIIGFSTHFRSHAETTFQKFGLGNNLLVSHADRIDVATRLQVLKHLLEERFSAGYWQSGRKYNAPALDRLTQCTLEGTCGPGESTVIILASFHFGNARAGHVSGEDIWAHSTMVAFEALNYTMLYTYGAMDTYAIYEQIPDLVPIVIWEGLSLDDCVKRERSTEAETDTEDAPGTWQKTDEIGCIKKESFPKGIPIWKSFAFHFWASSAAPLGGRWTLSPENWGSWDIENDNHYLGYSIEDKCSIIEVKEEREHRALILAKNPDMLEGKDFAWTGMLEAAAKHVPKNETGAEFHFVSTAGNPAGQGGPEPLPEKGVISMGKMPQMKWWQEVAMGKAMLGVGRPFMSPSPYDAMCFGVPFINVIFYRDEDHPEDRTRWSTMHQALLAIDEPYVYHVKQHNATALQEALDKAVSNPIGRYIPPWMTLESVKNRHRELVEYDWQSLAAEVMEEKWPNGDCPFAL